MASLGVGSNLLEPASLTLSAMWENVLLIMYKSPTLDYSNTTCAENVSSTSNFYSSLIYDALLQLLSSRNQRFLGVRVLLEQLTVPH